MANKINQKLELLTNFTIICLVILLGYLLVQNYLFPTQKSQPQDNPTPISQTPSGVKLGAKLYITGIDWKNNKKTLVIFSRKGCTYCTQSMPFYKDLAEKQSDFKTKIVVASSDSVEKSKRYFKENGVDLPEIRKTNVFSVGVRGTPTLLLVNHKGEILKSWVGMLSKEKEKEVIRHL